MFCRLFILFFFLGFLAGCSSSPLARYPEFPQQKKSITSTIILSDVVLIHSLLGDTSSVDLVEDHKTAKQCLQLFAGRMNEKGYNVDRTLNTSAGLLMNNNRTYRIARMPEEQLHDEESLDLVNPPFYLHELFSRDTIRRQLLALVYSSLMDYQKEKGESSKTIPAAVYLGKSLGGGMIGVLFLGGYSVGATRQFGQYTPPTNLAEDKIGVQTISQFTIMFYLIDSSTGEVLWDDRVSMKGGALYDEKLQKMIELLCDELP